MGFYSVARFLLILSLAGYATSQEDLLSCRHRCLNVYNNQYPCQCNKECIDYENCCSDYFTEECDKASYDSCENRCKVDYDYSEDCQCTDECDDDDNDNCCSDFFSLGCPAIQDGVYTSGPTTSPTPTTPPVMSPDSCAGRCGSKYNSTALCQCDTYCLGFNDCCYDVKTRCSNLFPTDAPQTTTPVDLRGTCTDRCGEGLDSYYYCQCNSACLTYDDCCDDYQELCVPINFDELMSELWVADVNRISEQYYSTDYQGYKPDYNDPTDISNDNLFTSFDESYIYDESRTFESFRKLCDNYEPVQGIPEDDTLLDIREVEDFLDIIFETEVINITAQALIGAGEFATVAEFRAKLKEMWFDHYRRNADYDSSGFEHVFCGELKTSSSVNGFHNWIVLYEREKAGELNYHSYANEIEPKQLSAQFSWNGAMKSRSGILLGVSPEFEFAVFTTMWIMQPNSVTAFTVTDGDNSYNFQVQAYVQNGKYVGTCYFIV